MIECDHQALNDKCFGPDSKSFHKTNDVRVSGHHGGTGKLTIITGMLMSFQFILVVLHAFGLMILTHRSRHYSDLGNVVGAMPSVIVCLIDSLIG